MVTMRICYNRRQCLIETDTEKQQRRWKHNSWGSQRTHGKLAMDDDDNEDTFVLVLMNCGKA